MTLLVTLPPFNVGEEIAVPFDYTAQLPSGETITAASVTPFLYSGTDANYASNPIGAPTINGAVVTQLIAAGVAGCVYRYLCKATFSDGQVREIVVQVEPVDYLQS